VFVDDAVGLGIRLWVIHLIRGDQPIFNGDLSAVVSDTEVIVDLYEDHGVDCMRFTNKAWSPIQLELWLRTFNGRRLAAVPTLAIPELAAT
jgi:hypothetical protein